MKIRAIITGATGMVGEGVLQECMDNGQVEKILLINRKPSHFSHPKVEEIIHADFNDLSPIAGRLQGYNACFFCAGVSSVGMAEEQYRALTYTLTLNFARHLSAICPDMTFCYVSGAGTDSSGRGKVMWARVKGQTENDLQQLPFKAVYNFRPAFMKPSKGARNIKWFFKPVIWLYPLLKMLMGNYVLTMEQVGKAMIRAAAAGYYRPVAEVKDIAALAREA